MEAGRARPWTWRSRAAASPSSSRTALAITLISVAPFAIATPPPAAPSPTWLPAVEVTGTTPLPGLGLPRARLPYSVHRDSRPNDDVGGVLERLQREIPGIQLNDIQGNRLLTDLTYRGFRASPILGAGQGLSVYLDGVRLNEPFGDIVSWDLIPQHALSDLTLTSSGNPAFGLNSLGGALVFRTLDGLTAPGFRGALEAGSFGHRQADLSYGYGRDHGFHAFVSGSAFEETGWRDASGGELGQLLLKLGHRSSKRDWHLGVHLGASTLLGNGLVPFQRLQRTDQGLARQDDLYAHRQSAVYTHPDRGRHRYAQLQLGLQQELTSASKLSFLAYAREARRRSVNGDEAEEGFDDSGEGNAALNRATTYQLVHGVAASVAGESGSHQWQLGGSFDESGSRYWQFEQEGVFSEDRAVEPIAEPELEVKLVGRSQLFGMYVTDTWALTPLTDVTATLRHNHARIANRLHRWDSEAETLTARPRESFQYDSLNPALGLAHRVRDDVRFSLNVARNTRIPTAIELGCADPAEPCRLPIALQSDPYLKQVVSHALEMGLEYDFDARWQLALAAYRHDNRNDILFHSVSLTGQQGYFQNFPRTRHEGADLTLRGADGPWALRLAYSLLDASYQAHGLLRQGPRNVRVKPGSPIAGLPRHQLKLGLDFDLSSQLQLTTQVHAVSSRIAMGNEDQRINDEDDLQARLDTAGYALLHVQARWRSVPKGEGQHWELVGGVHNLLDRRYETFSASGHTVFDPQGQYTGAGVPAVFVAPGSPRQFNLRLGVFF